MFTRREIIKASIQDLSGRKPRIKKGVISLVANTVFKQMSLALLRGEKMGISGVGTFKPTADEIDREIRNPKTGEKIHVKGILRRVHFIASRKLKGITRIGENHE